MIRPSRRTNAGLLAALFLSLLALPRTARADDPTPGADPATQRMVERLAEISRQADIQRNSFLNDRRVRALEQMPEPVDKQDLVQHLYRLGREMTLAGQADRAVAVLERLVALLDANNQLGYNEVAVEQIHAALALAYLRLGEQENCVDQHTIDRCLLPIRGSGVHQKERGSRSAMAIYLQLLEKHPDNLGYRWLLNLAAMTLGEHPDAVPEAWRIPSEAFASDSDLGRFPDVAQALGLDVFGLSGGSILEDFEGDGRLDIMASGFGLDEQIRLFKNNGDGGFTETTEAAGLMGITGGLNLKQADYDNDGDVDVLVLRGAWLRRQGAHPNSLLQNQGNGTFRDVTEAAGLLSFHPTQTADWGDYDNDGWLDLFIGNESVEDVVNKAELFHSNGDGTFTDVAAEAGVDLVAFIKGASWGDYDNDGRLDLYVSKLARANSLLRNAGPDAEGRWRFVDVTEKAGVGEPLESFPTWFWDYDNDGWLDLFVSGYRARIDGVAAEYLGLPFQAERPRLYHNNGDGTFTDRARTSGLDKVLYTMGCNFGDLDNDGFLDFYVGTGDTEFDSLMPNRMFRNDAGKSFQDVTTSGGFGHLQKGHGVAFGDLDEDGDQDIYAVMGGAHSGDGFTNVLFENPGHGNAWLTLRLVGETANRSAIGARISVTIAEAGGKERTIEVTVGSGASFGASSLQQEIGLGHAEKIVSVRIAWPGTPPVSPGVQVVEDLEPNRAYRIRQGQAAEPLTLHPFRLGGGATIPAPPHVHPAPAKETAEPHAPKKGG